MQGIAMTTDKAIGEVIELWFDKNDKPEIMGAENQDSSKQ